MKVGFYMVFRRDPQHYELADLMVRSVRAAMPSVEVVHFTDQSSPEALGVDRVERLEHGPLLERRLESFANCDGDWLFLDTDVIVQKDVRHVFDAEFDIAIADRQWPHIADPYKDSPEMPYNTGVVFSRNPAFYARVLEVWRRYPPEKRSNWWSEQWAVADVAREGQFRVHVLPGMTFNRPPATMAEDVSDAAIVHYKGPRKAWMLGMLACA